MSDAALEALPFDLSHIVIEITENERVADDEKLTERLSRCARAAPASRSTTPVPATRASSRS